MSRAEERFWLEFERDAPTLERELFAEFGPPEKVAAALRAIRNAYREEHGEDWMDAEQADWEGGEDGN